MANRSEGYLLIDHRNSPGISEADAMRLRKLGHNCPVMREGSVTEYATKRCCHCYTPTIYNPKKHHGHCRKCDDFVCAGCTMRGGCTPMQKQIDLTFSDKKRIFKFLEGN